MTLHNIFLGIGVLAILSNAFFWIMIMSALDRRGYKTNIVLSRLHFFKYMSAYREATRKETGKTGLLFYLWIGSIGVMAAALLLASRQARVRIQAGIDRAELGNFGDCKQVGKVCLKCGFITAPAIEYIS